MDYVTIASTGNATDFGDLTVARSSVAPFKFNERFVSVVYTPSYQDVVDYITIASTGNALDFGDLTFTSCNQSNSQASNNVRGVVCGVSTKCIQCDSILHNCFDR